MYSFRFLEKYLKMIYQGKLKYSTSGKYPSLIELNKLADKRGIQLIPERVDDKTVFHIFKSTEGDQEFVKTSLEYDCETQGRIRILTEYKKHNKI